MCARERKEIQLLAAAANPDPEARSPIPDPIQPGAARPGPVKPEQLFWLCPGPAWDWAKKMGRSTWLQPSITRTIYIHIR